MIPNTPHGWEDHSKQCLAFQAVRNQCRKYDEECSNERKYSDPEQDVSCINKSYGR